MVCGDRVAPEIEEQKTLVEFDVSSVRWSAVLSRHGMRAGRHGCPRSVSGGLRATCLTVWTSPNPAVAGRRELRYQILAAAASLLRHRLFP